MYETSHLGISNTPRQKNFIHGNNISNLGNEHDVDIPTVEIYIYILHHAKYLKN
jgi:hypothetical protein